MESYPPNLYVRPTERLPSYISAGNFPPPDRVVTFAEPLTDEQQEIVAQRSEFANWQARVASGALEYLHSLEIPITTDWEALYESIAQERADLNLLWKDQGVARSNRNLLVPISDESPNQDRVGDAGRFRINPEWDEASQRWINGQQTPAGQALVDAGERALDRFTEASQTGDILQNKVLLPDGQQVLGNQIVQGATATERLIAMRDAIASRGVDVGHFETGGDIVLLVSGTEADRATIFQAAMNELASLSQRNEQCSRQEFANLVYLLFQSPIYKRGSDSVIRTFAAAASTYLLDQTMVLPKDVDLRAATMTQADFVDYIS